MRCRKIEDFVDENGIKRHNVVFFEVKGVKKGTDGIIHSVFSGSDGSYADGIEGVCQSLTQRLTLIKGELVHFLNAGFPLLDKSAGKNQFDSYVLRTVSRHTDVESVSKIVSSVSNGKYTCNITISTNYGSATIKFVENV